MKSAATPAPLWVLSDGRAGNEKQALALAAALGGALQTYRLQTRAPWKWFAPHWVPGSLQAFGLDAQPPQRLIAIGCGRQAALALRTLKRIEPDARTVQILDPRIDTSSFDLVVAPAHDRLAGANVVVSRGALHAVDGAWLARARLEWARLGALPAPRTVLLLGGSNSAVRLDERYWRGLSAKLGHWLTRDGGSLLVASSRRSPDWLREAARAEFSAVPGMQWHGPEDGLNPYAGLLAWADRIVVTPDSINLLSEACATSAPVLCHIEKPVRGKHAHFYRELLEAGRLRPMKLEYTPWDVQPLREIEAIARQVRERLTL